MENAAIAQRLRDQKPRRMSFREISDRTGFNAETVRRYFAGESAVPATFVAKFCEAFGVSATTILLGDVLPAVTISFQSRDQEAVEQRIGQLVLEELTSRRSGTSKDDRYESSTTPKAIKLDNGTG